MATSGTCLFTLVWLSVSSCAEFPSTGDVALSRVEVGCESEAEVDMLTDV